VVCVRELEDSLSAVASAGSVEELWRSAGRSFSNLGYVACTYLDVRRLPLSGEPLPFYVSSVRNDFVETYVAEDFLGYDPVIQRAATTNAPFTWDDCPEYHSWRRSPRGAKSRARHVMQVANDFGFTDGYVIPVHAVDRRGRPASALVSLYWEDRPEILRTSSSRPAWLRLAAASMHEKMLELRGLSNDEFPPPSLTDRERECLVWACRGKTRNETADILNISDRTVEFHFQNAMKKLGVHNKYHAIAVAIHMGIISP
jgi:DNA-binding CsgD family transcriptional regulator